MKILLLFLVSFIFICNAFSQTLIGTSLNPDATANHNQRKIVRDMDDNIFIVFADSANNESIIKGVKYDVSAGTWGETAFLAEGTNPTFAISLDGRLHLVYETNEQLSRIKYTSSTDFLTWSPAVLVSNPLVKSHLPVADVDGSGKVNILWIQKYGELGDSLFYAGKFNNNFYIKKVLGKASISDVSIANHLQYEDNMLFVGMHFNNDSVLFFTYSDNLNKINVLHKVAGSSPAITYNTGYFYDRYPNSAKFLYINQHSHLREAEMDEEWETVYDTMLQFAPVDFICVDDIAQPLGYSYLFMKGGILYHAFSDGWGDSSIMRDTISSNPLNPSIAYKTFRFYHVDFIWMEDEGTHFNIYHKRDPKYYWVGVTDPENDKGFLITAYPNPFTDVLTLKVSVDEGGKTPIVKIYNSSSQVVNELQPIINSDKEYEYRWKGDNKTGEKIDSGMYIIHCSVGNKATARKVMYISPW